MAVTPINKDSVKWVVKNVQGQDMTGKTFDNYSAADKTARKQAGYRRGLVQAVRS